MSRKLDKLERQNEADSTGGSSSFTNKENTTSSADSIVQRIKQKTAVTSSRSSGEYNFFLYSHCYVRTSKEDYGEYA